KRSNIVVHRAAQPHHFDGVRAHALALLPTQGQNDANDREQKNDQHAGHRPEKKFEMEMLRTEEPLDFCASESWFFLCLAHVVGARWHARHSQISPRASLLPWRLIACG